MKRRTTIKNSGFYVDVTGAKMQGQRSSLAKEWNILRKTFCLTTRHHVACFNQAI